MEEEEDSITKRPKVINVAATVPEVTFTEKWQEQSGRGAGIQGLG